MTLRDNTKRSSVTIYETMATITNIRNVELPGVLEEMNSGYMKQAILDIIRVVREVNNTVNQILTEAMTINKSTRDINIHFSNPVRLAEGAVKFNRELDTSRIIFSNYSREGKNVFNNYISSLKVLSCLNGIKKDIEKTLRKNGVSFEGNDVMLHLDSQSNSFNNVVKLIGLTTNKLENCVKLLRILIELNDDSKMQLNTRTINEIRLREKEIKSPIIKGAQAKDIKSLNPYSEKPSFFMSGLTSGANVFGL